MESDLIDFRIDFRIFYLSVVVLTVTVNIFLVSNGYSSWSIYLLTVASVIMAVLMIGIYRNQKDTDKFKQINNNVKESQRMIFEVENKVLPFLRRRNAIKLENISIEKAAVEPFNWIICIFVFLIFFTTETFTNFNFNDPMKLISLVLMSLFQLMLLSIAISGIIVVLYKKTKGD